jgi:hypothetical protein
VQLADPGLLGERAMGHAEMFSADAPRAAMTRGAKMADELTGIEIQPEDITVGGVVEARFSTG